jgi:hypothetical protein
LYEESIKMTADLPPHLVTQMDRARLMQERLIMQAMSDTEIIVAATLVGDSRRRAESLKAYVNQRYDEVLTTWVGAPSSPFEQLMLLESAAYAGTTEQLSPLLESIRQDWPADACFASAQFAAQDNSAKAAEHLLAGFKALRQQVWTRLPFLQSALSLVPPLTAANPKLASLFFDALEQPFPGGLADVTRMSTLVEISPLLSEDRQLKLVAMFEPNPPWMQAFLEFRVKVYQRTSHRLLRQADQDLQAYLKQAEDGQ